MAKPVKEFKDLEHPQRSRIAVRHRQMMINDQNVLARRSSGPLQKRNIAISWPFASSSAHASAKVERLTS